MLLHKSKKIIELSIGHAFFSLFFVTKYQNCPNNYEFMTNKINVNKFISLFFVVIFKRYHHRLRGRGHRRLVLDTHRQKRQRQNRQRLTIIGKSKPIWWHIELVF